MSKQPQEWYQHKETDQWQQLHATGNRQHLSMLASAPCRKHYEPIKSGLLHLQRQQQW
jgi:hypothetical protein